MGFSDQPGSMSQCSNRHGSVVGCHPAECITGYKRRLGAQVRGTERRDYTGRTCADNKDV